MHCTQSKLLKLGLEMVVVKCTFIYKSLKHHLAASVRYIGLITNSAFKSHYIKTAPTGQCEDSLDFPQSYPDLQGQSPEGDRCQVLLPRHQGLQVCHPSQMSYIWQIG